MDVLYQATLELGAWSGRVDFLRKVPTPSSLGAWSYEAWDTKLARETKGGTILQLCVYSYLLERIQGARPARMHVVTPGTDFEPVSYRVDDFGAYFRLLERGIDGFLAGHEATYPDLVSHCDYCAWWSGLRGAPARRRSPLLRGRHRGRPDQGAARARRRQARDPGGARSGAGARARIPRRADSPP